MLRSKAKADAMRGHVGDDGAVNVAPIITGLFLLIMAMFVAMEIGGAAHGATCYDHTDKFR